MPDPISATAGAIAGSALIGGSAAKSAAKTQAKAADQAAQLQQQQFEQTRQDQMPFLQSGVGAVNRLNELLGLESQPAYQTTNAPPPRPSSGFLANAMFDRGLVQLGDRQNAMPMARAPRGADFGKYARDFGMQDFEEDPGAEFRRQAGEDALKRAFAARGGFLSGGAGKALTRYGQDYASQEYMNAFNRFQTNRANQLNPLQSMAGMGQTTAQQLGQAGQNYATGAGEALTSGAAARASGYVGQANALTGALGTGLNFYQNQQYMNKFAPTSTADYSRAAGN
jgi:hypothetical protein